MQILDHLNLQLLKVADISGNPFSISDFSPSPNAANSSEVAQASLNRVLEILLMIALPVAIIAVIYTAYQLITSNGKPDVMEKAKKNLITLVIGIFLVTAAAFLASTFYKLVSTPGVTPSPTPTSAPK